MPPASTSNTYKDTGPKKGSKQRGRELAAKATQAQEREQKMRWRAGQILEYPGSFLVVRAPMTADNDADTEKNKDGTTCDGDGLRFWIARFVSLKEGSDPNKVDKDYTVEWMQAASEFGTYKPYRGRTTNTVTRSMCHMTFFKMSSSSKIPNDVTAYLKQWLNVSLNIKKDEKKPRARKTKNKKQKQYESEDEDEDEDEDEEREDREQNSNNKKKRNNKKRKTNNKKEDEECE